MKKQLKRLMQLLVSLAIMAIVIVGFPNQASANALVTVKAFGNMTGDVAVDSSGYLYTALNLNGATVTKLDASGNIVANLGPALVFPGAITVDSSGYIYVVDKNPGNLGQSRVAKLDAAGNVIWQNIVGWLADDVAVDSNGNVFVVNGDYHSLVKYDSNFTWIATFGGVTVGSPLVAGVATKGTDAYFSDTAG